MKKLFTIIALFIAVISFSQTEIKRSSISSGGSSVTNGTTSVLYTIGEVAVQENTNGTLHISEGFISSVQLETLGVATFSPLEKVSIYPNPTVDVAIVRFEKIDTYTISIFNSLGNELQKLKTNEFEQELNFVSYVSGIYIVLVTNSENQTYKTFKIIKK